MPSKFEFNKGKMVPYPSGAIVPDRDLGERPALECIHLGIEFGGLKAVDDFSLTIGKTEIAGLIGPNGAGKTTVFNLLTKVYQPTHGTILLDGEDTSGKSVYQVNRMGIARTFQNIRLFKKMTVIENVKAAMLEELTYNMPQAIFRTKAYWKQEAAATARAKELLQVVPLRRYGKSLGCEKIILKQGRMQMQFVSNPNSAYYKSATFGKVLNYIAANARRCDLKEVRGKRYMVVSGVPTVSEAVKVLLKVKE